MLVAETGHISQNLILAATAQLQQESGDDVIVATTNLSHLAPLVPAAHWYEVGP